MAEKKESRPGVKRKKASGTKKKRVSSKGQIPKGKGPKRAPADDLSHRTDQIGALLNKGLDLAEAGIGLGVNLVSRLGSMVQEQVISKITAGERSGGVNPHVAPENVRPGTHSAEQEGPSPQFPEAGGILNRMPLSPGSTVSISFSINNDSPSSKKLKLAVEGFTGETHQFNFGPQTFSVHPSEKVIAPMDFDKFTLKGDIPQEAPEDSYDGCIMVTGEEKFKIPVTLILAQGL